MKLLSPDAIRRCIVADLGMSIFTADYDQIELRVVAALANETAMIEAAKKGESLHITAANRIFGVDHTPDQYKLSKNINFTFVYGGSARTMSERYSIPYPEAQKLIADYREAFPSLTRYMRQRQDAILRDALSTQEYKVYKTLLSHMFEFRNDTKEGRSSRARIQDEMNRLTRGKFGYTTTSFGRRLIVDAAKPYTVVNYEVQSTAADIFKHGFLRVMADEELEPTVLLPIHDELLGQGPKKKALYLATRYGEVMTTEFQGVPITASGKVYGRSWGHGYRKEA
jgi:DNA polymerase I-like protein with 3'-5' exonuclease and polymerase domains